MDHGNAEKKLGFVKRDRLLLALLGAALLAVTGYVFYDTALPEWKEYQAEFRDLVGEKFGAERAASIPAGLRQVHVPQLGVTDRCVTCHQATEWKGLEGAPEPFRTHPAEILKSHPVDRFGCTPCHGGQGFATESADAHGLVEHWEEPMLGKDLAEFYVLSDRSAMMQLRCNACHRYERATKGADAINRAKQVINEKGCRACHVINGRGGTVGPDLTTAGEKSPEQFNYERIKGFHSQFTWQVAHLKNPKELVPETVMPNFGFSSADAQALALVVMSWRRSPPPVEYIPGHNFRDVPSAKEREKEERMRSGPGAFFVSKGCFVCHAVSSFGVEAAAQIGPDLALAVEDVQSRFGRTLDDFMARPTGTMDVVLATMIPLTKEERAQAVALLREAYALKTAGTPPQTSAKK
jgi:cytochrome c2